MRETVPVCPTCGGEVAVVGKRAWCIHPYDRGGCGSHWPKWKARTVAFLPADEQERRRARIVQACAPHTKAATKARRR